jgi:general secretion pathway protein F
MAAFSYQALDANGNLSRGIIEGESERQVRQLLRARQLKPISVSPSQAGAAWMVWRARGPRPLPLWQLVLLTRQLATLVKAGVPLDEALGATARQSLNAAAKTVLLQLRSKVVAGQSFTASLAAFPQIFSGLYQALVKAGEQAGLLGEVLEKVADYLEVRQQLQNKLQMALIYPCALISVAVLVITVLMVKVLPDLNDLFIRNGSQLPLLTRMLMALSRGVATWWPLLLLMGVLVPVLLQQLLQRAKWRARLDAFSLKLPLVGSLLQAADTARFASTLSLLTASGVALVDALAIACGVMGNMELRAAASVAARAVEEGGSLARALEQSDQFPPLLVQMVASGESSGKLDTMLARAASMQERELEQTINGLLKILEPLLLVVMAVIVGTIVLAVLLPIMQMNTLVG